MTSRLFKILAMLAITGLVAGCKLLVVSPPGGNITSLSATRNCVGGSVCEFPITADFSESFTAVPKPGYQFVRWEKGTGLNCGDSTNPTCTVALTGNAALDAAAIATFEIIHIMPIYKDVGIDTDGDGQRNELDADDDNDGIPDSQDLCPLDSNVNCGINDVSGIIYSDTTWSADNGPIRLVGTVQIAQGATLTIAEGVHIIGAGHQLQIFGNLKITGTSENLVIVDDLYIGIESNLTGSIEIIFAHITGGNPASNRGSNFKCRFVLRNSIIEDVGVGITVIWEGADSYIERNVFRRINYMTIVSNARLPGTGSIHIRNNLFEQVANVIQIGGQKARIFVEYNSFLFGGSPKFNLWGSYGYHEGIIATNNYWGTTDLAIVEDMVVDRADDLSLPGFVEYVPILTAPHPDTPTGF